MTQLLVLPIIVPLLTAALCLACWQRPRRQVWISTIGSVAHFFCAALLFTGTSDGAILVTQAGSWHAPYGITLVADRLSGTMTVLAAGAGLLAGVFANGSMDARRIAFGFYPLLHILLMGVCGSFLTGDIFNLYVWFEVMLMASFVLMALGGEKAQLEAAIKYVTLNLLSSTIFLTATGLLYSVTGTLNMADLSLRLRDFSHPGLLTTISVLYLVAFGLKAGLFPFYFWLPASYHVPSFAVSALFAGLLTKVGVYSLIRVFTLLFTADAPYTQLLVLTLACLTMVTGALGAISQNNLRRVFSFLVISGVGFATLGLGLGTEVALAASVFYLVHSVIANTGIFLLTGMIEHFTGTRSIKRMGGLIWQSPRVALLFLLMGMSVAGMPPFSGFVAKVGLLKAAFEGGYYLSGALLLISSLIAISALARLGTRVIWGRVPEREPGSPDSPATRVGAGAGPGVEGSVVGRVPLRAPVGGPATEPGVGGPASLRALALPGTEPARAGHFSQWGPVLILTVATICLGLGAAPVYQLAEDTARQLTQPNLYVAAVLGDLPEAGILPTSATVPEARTP